MKSNPTITAPQEASAGSSLLAGHALPFATSDASDPQRHLAWQIAPNLWRSFQYAWAGVRYAFVTQRNFRIHVAIAALALALCAILQVGTVKAAIVGLTCALVMVLELLNTALESIVDLTVRNTYHELAKIAKDCAAGAVLIAAIASVLVACLLLVPPLLAALLAL